MLSHVVYSIILVVVVAQSIAFNLPHAISLPRSNPLSCKTLTSDASLEVTGYDTDKRAGVVDREDISAMRSGLTLGNLNTVTTALVTEKNNVYEIYKRAHLDESERNDAFEKWILKLFNDSSNTRSRVCQCLVRDAGLSEEESYLKMMHAHKHGEAIIGEYCQEQAEHYKEALEGSGLICDIFPVHG
jgi:ATP-dependent Clp protease adapter protein ClpS